MADKKLVKDLKTKIEALVIAIPRELDAYEYYIDLAERYDDQTSKEMFMFLAKQELYHKDMLERMLNELQQKLEEEIGG